jgi:hypothetical protein
MNDIGAMDDVGILLSAWRWKTKNLIILTVIVILLTFLIFKGRN